MTTHFLRELDNLKRHVFALVGLVEENLARAVESVQERNEALALDVIEGDHEIDRQEIVVEEECLKILALHQPVAIDLRFIIAVLKLNGDLERIGDLAVNVAERATFLAGLPPLPIPIDFGTMAAKSSHMLKRSVDALSDSDAAAATEVCAADDEVDAINREIYAQVKAAIAAHPAHLDALIHALSVSRYLERVADHATNIAEDVVYLVEGRIIRHAPEVPGHHS